MDMVSKYWDKIVDYVTDAEKMFDLAMHGVRIILIVIAAKLISKIANRAVQRIMAAKEKNRLKLDIRRTETITKLFHNCITYTVNIIAIMLILGQLGINMGPLLAGAGIVGLAIGFGAQNLVRDVITGFFIIFEDQFAVGDVIQVGDFRGTVEEIGIRVTRLKSWTGEVLIIPNGSITQVINYSLSTSVAVVDISIAYETDLEKALDVLRSTVQQIYQSNELIVAEPSVLGVQMIGNSYVVLRVTAECKNYRHFEVSRTMYAEIKKQFDAHGIEIPYPKTVTYLKEERAVTPDGP